MDYEKKHQEIIKKFSDQEENLKDTQKSEFEQAIKTFYDAHPEKNPKLSSEILNLYKQLEEVVKEKK